MVGGGSKPDKVQRVKSNTLVHSSRGAVVVYHSIYLTIYSILNRRFGSEVHGRPTYPYVHILSTISKTFAM